VAVSLGVDFSLFATRSLRSRRAVAAIPPPPEDSTIMVRGEPPERVILLPRLGWKLLLFIYVAIAAMAYHARGAWPITTFAAIAGILFSFTYLTNTEIAETGDTLSFGTRLFGIALAKRIFLKDEIVGIGLQPALKRHGEAGGRIAKAAAGRLLTKRAAALSPCEITWLEQAVAALVQTR
jgi:hypothetical protein